MRQLGVIVSLIYFCVIAQGQAPFKFTVNTELDGVSCSSCFALDIRENDYTYNFDVDWDGDGVYDQFNLSDEITHDYGTPGIYTISIRGDFSAISNYWVVPPASAISDCKKFISIDQWGDIQWQTMRQAFNGCTNLQYNASDAPDLSNVTDLVMMFSYCESLNADLNSWDVSNIEDMSYMFREAVTFNGNLNNWNTSNVIKMTGMFQNTNIFNSPLNAWNTSNVTSMDFMFSGAHDFNQPLDNWNTSTVTNMKRMFLACYDFNQNISMWQTHSVTDMASMFSNCWSFNQDLSSWDISNVTTFDWAFSNSDLSSCTYDKILEHWSSQNVQSNVEFGAVGINYCSSSVYRQSLIDNYNWTITDDGQGCSDLPSVTLTQSDTSSCLGDSTGALSAVFSNGISPYSYALSYLDISNVILSSTANSMSVSDIPVGEYYISFTDASGCSGFDSLTIIEPPTVHSVLDIYSHLDCANDSTAEIGVKVLVGGTPPYNQINWYEGSVDPSNEITIDTTTSNGNSYTDSLHVGGLSFGTYILEIQDDNGCYYYDTVEVDPVPEIHSVLDLYSALDCANDSTAEIGVVE